MLMYSILVIAQGGGPAALSEGTRRGCAQGEDAGEQGPRSGGGD